MHKDCCGTRCCICTKGTITMNECNKELRQTCSWETQDSSDDSLWLKDFPLSFPLSFLQLQTVYPAHLPSLFPSLGIRLHPNLMAHSAFSSSRPNFSHKCFLVCAIPLYMSTSQKSHSNRMTHSFPNSVAVKPIC